VVEVVEAVEAEIEMEMESVAAPLLVL